VVSWRLMNVRKGWTGKLFSPYMLWFRIAGWLFLVAGFIKLIQRNLTGIWAIVVAIALIFLSGILKENASSTMKCNTWGSRKGAAILSAYGKTLQTDYHG